MKKLFIVLIIFIINCAIAMEFKNVIDMENFCDQQKAALKTRIGEHSYNHIKRSLSGDRILFLSQCSYFISSRENPNISDDETVSTFFFPNLIVYNKGKSGQKMVLKLHQDFNTRSIKIVELTDQEKFAILHSGL